MATNTSQVFRAKTTNRSYLTFSNAESQFANRNREIEKRAFRILERHPHFTGRRLSVEFRCDGECLSIHGCLPSYYLKQLAQEAVRRLSNQETIKIVNEIVVLSSCGEVGLVVSRLDGNSAPESATRKPR